MHIKKFNFKNYTLDKIMLKFFDKINTKKLKRKKP